MESQNKSQDKTLPEELRPTISLAKEKCGNDDKKKQETKLGGLQQNCEQEFSNGSGIEEVNKMVAATEGRIMLPTQPENTDGKHPDTERMDSILSFNSNDLTEGKTNKINDCHLLDTIKNCTCNNSRFACSYHKSKTVSVFQRDKQNSYLYLIMNISLFFQLRFKKDYVQDTVAKGNDSEVDSDWSTSKKVEIMTSTTFQALVYPATVRVEPDYGEDEASFNIDPNGSVQIYSSQDIRLGNTMVVDVGSDDQHDQIGSPIPIVSAAHQQMAISSDHQATANNNILTTITQEYSHQVLFIINHVSRTLFQMQTVATHLPVHVNPQFSAEFTSTRSIAASRFICAGFPLVEFHGIHQERERPLVVSTSHSVVQTQACHEMSNSQASAVCVTHQESTILTETLSQTGSAGFPGVAFSSLNIAQYMLTHSASRSAVATVPTQPLESGHQLHSSESNMCSNRKSDETVNQRGVLPTGVDFDHTLSIDLERPPKFPDFSCLNARRQSFLGWTRHVHQTSDDLATAGFFYCGTGTRDEDLVKCFYCGGVLPVHTWDPGDDPWIEHARRFPSCCFLLQKKGSDFIKNVNSSPPQLEASGTCDSGQDGRTTESELESLKNENDCLQEKITCMICKEKQVSIVFLPCGHLVCCIDCGPAMRRCPVCGVHVKRKMHNILI